MSSGDGEIREWWQDSTATPSSPSGAVRNSTASDDAHLRRRGALDGTSIRRERPHRRSITQRQTQELRSCLEARSDVSILSNNIAVALLFFMFPFVLCRTSGERYVAAAAFGS